MILRRQLSPEVLSQWCANLGHFPEQVIFKMLEATSQLVPTVEAENRMVPPHKHLVSRLLWLRHCRLRETFATDWFIVTTTSIQKFRGFQLYVGKQSKTLFPFCLRRSKFHMVESLRDIWRNIGILERLIMDGDGTQNNPEVTRVCREFLINVHNFEPEN